MHTENQTQTGFFERIELFLYSRKFIFLVVILGTVPMIMHTHQLFFNVSPFAGNELWKNVYALFYAISFDLTILVFTIHYIKRKPQLYAGFAFVINLLYFNPFGFIPEVYVIGFTKVFLAVVLAFTGYSYAELFVDKVAENSKKANKSPVYKSANGQSKHDHYKCPKCGKGFKSIKALNGHMKVH
ncbi:MAG: C2H2-type zinc finger protein [Bacteroidota bacterium]